jgi:hypothetical protein
MESAMFKLALSFAALSFLFASPATAADKLSDKWIVTQLSGDARVVHPGARPASLSVNNQLAPGDTIISSSRHAASSASPQRRSPLASRA